MAGTKEARFEARPNPDDDELLAWAAAFTGTTKSAFVLGSALERARTLRAGDSSPRSHAAKPTRSSRGSTDRRARFGA